MKKMLFLSCLLIPAATQCMEKETPMTKHALQFSDIQHEVVKLNDLLYDDEHWFKGSNNDLAMLVICRFPKHEYKYVEDGGTGLFYDITLQKANPTVLADMHRFKSARYEGYSGIGAATLATSLNYDNRKKVIQNLLKAGFIPTEKDRLLALHLEQETNHARSDGKSDLLDSDLPNYEPTPNEHNSQFSFVSAISNSAISKWLYSFYDSTEENQ